MALEGVTDQPDLLKYAITQGGLLAVVLVLLWSYRKDFQSTLKDRGDRLQLMIDLVARSAEAQTKTADSLTIQAHALEKMSDTLAHVSLRSSDR